MAATPNYAGMFLRGYGSQNHTKNNGSTIGNTVTNHASSTIGIIQGDGTRNITGYIDSSIWNFERSDGVFFRGGSIGWTSRANGYNIYGEGSLSHADILPDMFCIENSRQVPVANEIRPVNMAVRYLIRTR